jgi:hypothetical protein
MSLRIVRYNNDFQVIAKQLHAVSFAVACNKF